MPSCAEKKRGETYKPRGGGNWKEKYDGLCIEKCGEDYDVVVHNTETDSCYCWEKDDGRWEDGDDKDVAYDVRRSPNGLTAHTPLPCTDLS